MLSLRNLFLPRHENDHQASLLKPQFLSVVTLFFVCSQIFLNFFTMTGTKVLGYSSNISPERIIELTNQKRAELGLGPVKENSVLSEAARRKAGDMFAFNYWAHTSPSGRDPWSFFKEAGYKYVYAGENLARDFRDPESVINAWMNSPSHRENMANSKYQEIGVAVVDGSLLGVETTLVVQLFGSQTRTAVAKKPAAKPTVVAQKPAVAEVPVTVSQPAKVPAVRSGETIITSPEVKTAPVFNPFSLTKILAIFLVGSIFGAFLVDFLLISERKTPRISGRSFAQMLFLGFIILLALVSKQGAIL